MRSLKYIFLPILCLTLAVPPAFPQNSANKDVHAQPAALNNDDVIALAGAGLSDDVIIAKIRKAPSTAFDTSVAGLKALKAAGVSSAVIRLMVDPNSAEAPTAQPAMVLPTAGFSDSDNPLDKHLPGIYALATGAGSKPHMVRLIQELPASAATGGGSMFLHSLTYGAVKGHVLQALNHTSSSVQISDDKPTFYAYLSENQDIRNIGLLKLSIKKDIRVADVGTVSGFAGRQATGLDPSSQELFTTEEIAPHIFKIQLKAPLVAGEYAFQQMALALEHAGGTSLFFTFGVHSAQ
ncbi:MAG: hypothetical protein WDN23_01270 [Edaphobacter sp.]